jgi:hypothetical protein
VLHHTYAVHAKCVGFPSALHEEEKEKRRQEEGFFQTMIFFFILQLRLALIMMIFIPFDSKPSSPPP